MKTVLQINSSIYNGRGESTQLADRFVAALLRRLPDTVLLKRELARDEVPHLTAERFRAFQLKPEERTVADRDAVAYSDALIDELRRADVIVLAACRVDSFGRTDKSSYRSWTHGEVDRY